MCRPRVDVKAGILGMTMERLRGGMAQRRSCVDGVGMCNRTTRSGICIRVANMGM